MTWRRAIRAADLPVGGTVSVPLEDEDILICRTEGRRLFALEDRCSHDGASFEDGPLHGETLTCPRHGARFNVADGRALSMPAVAPLEVFPIRVTEDGWVEVEVEE